LRLYWGAFLLSKKGAFMTLYFQNSNEQRRIIGRPENREEAYRIIREFLNDHRYKSYYMREWIDEKGETWVDVGSHTEFFIWC